MHQPRDKVIITCAVTGNQTLPRRANCRVPVCTENHIRVYQVTESAKLAQW